MSHLVRDAVEKDIAKLPPEQQDSGKVAVARSLADAIDHDKTSPTAKSLCAKLLNEILDQLHDLMPEDQEGKLDDLRARRDRRRSAA